MNSKQDFPERTGAASEGFGKYKAATSVADSRGFFKSQLFDIKIIGTGKGIFHKWQQCCGTGTAETVTFCLSRTGMHYGSGAEFGSGSNLNGIKK
jgi:hypothetical protein